MFWTHVKLITAAFVCAAVVVNLSAAEPPAQSAKSGPGSMRNEKLRDLPPNKWVKIGRFEGSEKGCDEVPWCYDADRKVLVRVGGCGGSSGGHYSNEVWSFDLGTLKWTENVPYGAQYMATCPGDGCNRGVCYDPDNRCIWTFGGATSTAMSGSYRGFWKGAGDLAPGKWTRIEGPPSTEQARVACDQNAKKVVCIGNPMGHGGRTWVYDPAANKTHEADASPYETGNQGGRRGLGQYPGFLYVPELKGCVLIAGVPTKALEKNNNVQTITWLFDATTGKWRDLAPKGAGLKRRNAAGVSYDTRNHVIVVHGGYAYGGPNDSHITMDDTWVYDPVKNTWTEMKPSATSMIATNSGARGDSQMMTYDEEHNVHVMAHYSIGVWVYRYK